MRKIFEPHMEALQSKYHGYWKYSANRRFRLLKTEDDKTEEAISLPTTLERMPDGAISDVSGLLLANEISSLETRTAAAEKMQMFFNNPSVIAGIVLNLAQRRTESRPTLRQRRLVIGIQMRAM